MENIMKTNRYIVREGERIELVGGSFCQFNDITHTYIDIEL